MNRLSVLRSRAVWIWLVAALAGATAIVRWDIAQRREELQGQARTAHRLLSQATERVDAVLETLVLLAQPRVDGSAAADPATRLPAVYPQVLAAWRRDAAGAAAAEAMPAGASVPRSAGSPRAQLTEVDGQAGQYTVERAGSPAGFALRIDARRLVSTQEWPWPDAAPVRATLAWGGRLLVLQAGPAAAHRPSGLTEGFEFTKTLASASQPFVLHVQRHTGPAEWPWRLLALWALCCLTLYGLGQRWLADRSARRRAAEQVRLAQAARLGAMGELAAGMAHELNQPLTAVLAGTQTALRTLRELGSAAGTPLDEDARSTLGASLQLAAAQARRAAEVVARLRRMVQSCGSPAAAVAVDLGDTALRLIAMMDEELRAAHIQVAVEGPACRASADAVAVEQVLHNLLTNAVQALREAPGMDRRIVIALSMAGDRVRCAVQDNGPGVSSSQAQRLFEPFFTTKPGGLGLGLPLCQTLATSMGGSVTLRPNTPVGAVFELELPALGADPATP